MNVVTMDVRDEVSWFAKEMESTLKRNDHKGGWHECDLKWLLQRLREETNELGSAVENFKFCPVWNLKPDRNVYREAADVANFAMMIADNIRRMMENKSEGANGVDLAANAAIDATEQPRL